MMPKSRQKNPTTSHHSQPPAHLAPNKAGHPGGLDVQSTLAAGMNEFSAIDDAINQTGDELG